MGLNTLFYNEIPWGINFILLIMKMIKLWDNFNAVKQILQNPKN